MYRPYPLRIIIGRHLCLKKIAQIPKILLYFDRNPTRCRVRSLIKTSTMKKSTKSLLFGVLGAAVLAGAYQNYRMSQTEKIASNLTLDNIESLALIMDCYAEATCPSGAVIHCSGGSSCESGPNESGGSYVICDGKYGSSCN